MSKRALLAGLIIVFAAAAALTAYGVTRPLAKSYLWHEFDTAAMARNYAREGMNPLYPRIDWRGDGPGYVESELPLLAWSSAALYLVFGEQELVARLLSYAVSLASLAVMWLLLRRFLEPLPALVAFGFYAFHPLVVGHSTSLQPDGWMVFFYVSGVYFFVRWIDERTWRSCLLAAGATALAILAKAPAAHVGLLMAFLVLRELGLRGLRAPMVWACAAGSLLPGLLWYGHAHGLYTAYGNSLGISDEAHWASWDLFTDPYFVKGIARHELDAWGKTGILVGLAALVRPVAAGAVRLGLAWYAAIVVFYLAAARTTGDVWAIHYHIVSVPVAALLVGAGFDAAIKARLAWPAPRLLVAAAAAFAAVGAIAATLDEPRIWSWRVPEVSIGLALFTALLVPLAHKAPPHPADARPSGAMPPLAAAAVMLALAGAFFTNAKATLWAVRDLRVPDELHVCAREMAPALVRAGLIVASGANELDHTGLPVAINAPYMLYWLDRKGFVVSREAQSVDRLRRFAARGAQYFVAEKAAIAAKPGFEAELRGTFPLVASCRAALTFDIGARP